MSHKRWRAPKNEKNIERLQPYDRHPYLFYIYNTQEYVWMEFFLANRQIKK